MNEAAMPAPSGRLDEGKSDGANARLPRLAARRAGAGAAGQLDEDEGESQAQTQNSNRQRTTPRAHRDSSPLRNIMRTCSVQT
jgi:hypothetical protein